MQKFLVPHWGLKFQVGLIEISPQVVFVAPGLPLLRSLPGNLHVTPLKVHAVVKWGRSLAGAAIPSLWMFPSSGFSGVSWCHTGDCDGSHQQAPGPGLCHHEEDAHPLPHQPACKSCLPRPPASKSTPLGLFLQEMLPSAQLGLGFFEAHP